MTKQEEAKNLYDEIFEDLAKDYDVSSGQMFGKPCLKLKKKAFASFFKGDMVFKLIEEDPFRIVSSLPGAKLWDPSGKKRPMKHWVQVPFDYSDDWLAYAKYAIEGMPG